MRPPKRIKVVICHGLVPFFVFSVLKRNFKVIVLFVDICEIVDHHFLNFLNITVLHVLLTLPTLIVGAYPEVFIAIDG